MIIVAVITVLVVLGFYCALYSASGMDSPYTTVTSQSMQHDNESAIGIIDTGDMVIVKSVEKTTITSYVSGSQTGYSKFGEYGDVIIYDRGVDQNPVIHRAILWLDYNGDGTWSAPSLAKFKDWHCIDSYGYTVTDYTKLNGKLTLENIGYGNKNPYIDLDMLTEYQPHGGYLTMGDNAQTNNNFDQQSGIAINGLISKDQIKSVAWIEIPWLGCIKLINEGKSTIVDANAPNSIPCLAVTIAGIIMLIISFNTMMDYRMCWKYHREREEELTSLLGKPPTP